MGTAAYNPNDNPAIAAKILFKVAVLGIASGLLIVVDRDENTSIAKVRETLQHEACHVFVDWQEPEEHGPMFRACMNRF
jgi:hypothetical protein